MNSFLHPKKYYSIFLFALLIFVFKNAAAQVPVITTNPTNQTVCGGSVATFQIVATNSPTSYTWQYSLNNGTTWTTISDNATYTGSSTSELAVQTTNGFLTFNYQYRCAASNGSGTSSFSAPANLKINILLNFISFIPYGSPSTVCQGATGIKYGVNSDEPLGGSYTWSYTGSGALINAISADSTIAIDFSTSATSGTLSVVSNSACGTTTPVTMPITVNNLQPTLAGISGSSASCTTSTFYSSNNTTGIFSDASCNAIGTLLQSGSSPVTGSVTNCVTIDASVQTYNGNPYVQRHYNIEPTNNASTATATVTLYFTQQDFDNFNAARGSLPALPTGPTDAAGISNIRVTQFHGAGTTPGTYVGTAGEINPDDNNIVWNASASRWEITFNITGFSGFFLSTASLTPLPLTLIDFKGTSASDGNVLQWITASEINVSHFEIERSEDGINYKSIGTINAIDNSSLTNNYSFKDAFTAGSKQVYYYRLNMVDIDGKSSYSKIIVLQPYEKNLSVKISPNPFIQQITATVISPDNDNGFIILTDAGGKKVMQQNIVLNKGLNTLQLNTVNQISKGIYFLSFSTTHDAQTFKIIKEE